MFWDLQNGSSHLLDFVEAWTAVSETQVAKQERTDCKEILQLGTTSHHPRQSITTETITDVQ